MKYTYSVSLQGLDRALHYLEMTFDRQLSGRYVSRNWDHYRSLGISIEPELKDLMDAIAHTPNVICDGTQDRFRTGGELIVVEGSRISIHIVPHKNIPEIAKQIAKKVQRRFAKGESRQRIKLKELQQHVAKLNKRTLGA